MNENQIQARIEGLERNIKLNIKLINEYQSMIGVEDDPIRLEKYRREIKRQRELMSDYQMEYDELSKISLNEPSIKMQQIGVLLEQMNSKIDNLQQGQVGILEGIMNLRNDVLSRFDSSDQKVLTAIVGKLNESQLTSVHGAIDLIDEGSIPKKEVKEALDTIQESLKEIHEQTCRPLSSQLYEDVNSVFRMIEDPSLSSAQKLKISIPIIPLLLNYEQEIELKGRINLRSVWQNLLKRVGCRND